MSALKKEADFGVVTRGVWLFRAYSQAQLGSGGCAARQPKGAVVKGPWDAASSDLLAL